MEGKVNPPDENPQASGLSTVIEHLCRFLPMLKGAAQQVQEFVANLFFLPQHRERRQIENMRLFLESVAEVIKQLKESGTDDETIRRHLRDLEVPLIEASLKAMLLLRHSEILEEREDSQQSDADPDSAE